MEKYKVYKNGRFAAILTPLLIVTAVAAALLATLMYGVIGFVSFLSHTSAISYLSLFTLIWLSLMIAGALTAVVNPLFAIMNNENIYFPDPECRIPWENITIHDGSPPPCRSEGNYLFLDVASPLHEELLEDGLTEDLIFCCDVESDDLPHRKLIMFHGDVLEQPIDEIRRAIESRKKIARNGSTII
jgi:hypothetical protein